MNEGLTTADRGHRSKAERQAAARHVPFDYEPSRSCFDFRKHKTAEPQFKQDLIHCAVRYARLRTDWQLARPDERHALESSRTAAHNALIDAAKILSRAMVKVGEDVTSRRELGDDRKEIGDWACFIHAHFNLQAR